MKINTPGSLLTLFSTLLISGCSTITHHKGTTTGGNSEGIYRGTREDVGGISLMVAHADEVATGDIGFGQWSFFFLFGLVDLPLSFVADTLYLPYDLATLGDTSEDLPIRRRLIEEYCPPNKPPTKVQILEELGPPFASAILSETNTNIPKDVMTLVRFAPKGSEVLVYRETNRRGRNYTYFIFIGPKTGRYIIYFTIVGEIRDDQWPNQRLR